MSPPKKKEPLLSDRTHAFLDRVVKFGLPALATMCFTLSEIWGWANGQAIVGSIAAFNVFLAVILGLSERSYEVSGEKYAGTFDVIDQGNGVNQFKFDLQKEPEELLDKVEVVFKVVHVPFDPGS